MTMVPSGRGSLCTGADLSIAECKARSPVLQLVVKNAKSALLRLPGVQLVQLGLDPAIDCQVLGGPVQLRQVVSLFELLLGCPLDPFGALLLENRWVAERIL